jgi:putative membrane protein
MTTTTGASPDRRPPESDTTQPALRQHVVRSTRTSRTWTAVILFVFVLQNGQRVKVSFLGFGGHLPLAVTMLFAAIAGALLIAIPGIGRIAQLRRIARRHRNAEAPNRGHSDLPGVNGAVRRALRRHPHGGES